MRLLVTGAAGFIGSHLCEALVRLGHEVIGIDAFVPYYPRKLKEQNIASLLEMRGFRFVEADLRTDDLGPILDGIEAVINEAAMPGLVMSWSELQLYVSCNILGLQRLLESARKAKVQRFIQASTSSVYGVEAVGDERLAMNPVSPYGVTKLAAEHLIMAYAVAYELSPVILRYFSIYGPRQRPDMAFYRFIEDLRHERPLTVYGDGLQSRTPTYVDDCVAGTILALNGGEPNGIYNIGGGTAITVLEAIDVISDEMGVKADIRFGPARVGDQRRTAADFSKAMTVLGYRPSVEPDLGLRQQVRWQLGLNSTSS